MTGNVSVSVIGIVIVNASVMSGLQAEQGPVTTIAREGNEKRKGNDSTA